jgi:predicted transcriptional regulator
LLRILETKGHVTREEVGPRRFVFRPSRPRERAARSALKRVLSTFFDDSAEKAVVALLDISDANLPQAELDRLVRLIEQSRKEGP